MTQPGKGPDLIGDFQRWLIRSGARSVSREVGGQIRSVLGRAESSGDVWQAATAEPPPAEAPECAWCPVCRAARMLRESGPRLASHAATASEVLAGMAQEAVSVFESVLAGAGRPGSGATPPPPRRDAPPPAGTGASPPAGPAGEPPDEPDDRG